MFTSYKFLNARLFRILFILSFFVNSYISEAVPNIYSKFPEFTDEINISIFSDPHFYSNELGNQGSAFEEYLKNDRKLLSESESIMVSLSEQLISEESNIILVPGDLTKDGELVNHVMFAEYLKKIESSGKKVYVVPGNHDILNPHAYRFDGDNKTRITNITPGDFENIYKDFGYSEAIYRDSNSLSYVVEPQQGLWILGIDCCKYDINNEEPDNFGLIKKETLDWIGKIMNIANEKGILVLAMMHHNILEHFANQKSMLNGIFEHSVVDNFEDVSEYFVSIGLNYVFTGHFHANDIVMKNDFKIPGFLYDIETGSTITYPCMYRKVKIQKNFILTSELSKIESIQLQNIKQDFEAFMTSNLSHGIRTTLSEKLENYYFNEEEINAIIPLAVYAMLSNYSGDEIQSYDVVLKIRELKENGGFMSKRIADGLKSLISDLYPVDRKIKIDLKTGEVKQDIITGYK